MWLPVRLNLCGTGLDAHGKRRAAWIVWRHGQLWVVWPAPVDAIAGMEEAVVPDPTTFYIK